MDSSMLLESSKKKKYHRDLIRPESVYESASEIGEHFKRLIQLFGPEPFESILPCVVRVLENLEQTVTQRNDCMIVIDQLQKQIDELQKEHQRRLEVQQKYQSEIEDIDELWRNENGKLEQYVRYLKTENKRLSSSLHNNDSNKYSFSLTDLLKNSEEQSTKQEETDWKKKNDLNDSKIDKLNAKIRLLQNEIEFKDEEIINLKIKNENLSKENGNLRNLVSYSITKLIDDDEIHQKNFEESNKTTNDETELRNRICNLEERLAFYKAHFHEAEELQKEKEDFQRPNDEEEEDLPVQGPIPKEPEEKEFNWSPQKRSRIWSFFPRLTKALISNNNNK